VQLAQGRLDAALGTYQRALEITTPLGQPALPAAGIAFVGMAEVEYQRGELDAALEHVTKGIARLRPVNYPSRWPLAWPRWRGFGRPRAMRREHGKRWARLSGSRQARRWPA